jgi:hypothetical protein
MQSFPHQFDIPSFQVPHATMNELGAARAGCLGEVICRHQQRAISACRCVDGHAESRRASSDDKHIVGVVKLRYCLSPIHLCDSPSESPMQSHQRQALQPSNGARGDAIGPAYGF